MLFGILFVIVFGAGIAVHRKYQDDPELNRFADALRFLVAFPVGLMYGTRAEQQKGEARDVPPPAVEGKAKRAA